MATRRRSTNLARALWLSIAALFAFTALGLAQRGNRNFGSAFETPVSNPKYDGQFTFARLKYTVGPGGY